MGEEKMIKILETSHVSPLLSPSPSPSPSPSSDSSDSVAEFTLPLTFLDTFCFKFPPVQCLFFYTLTNSSHHKSLISNLKHSLSITLLHYLPLAGTLIWPPDSPKPYVLYKPSDAVSFTAAESASGDFFRRLTDDRILCEALESRPLVPELRIDDTSASIAAIQVTLFPGSGFSVGVTGHHAFLDGRSTAVFMRSWAYVSKYRNCSLLPPELTPFFGRSVVEDPNGLEMVYLNRWLTKSKTRLFDCWPVTETSPGSVRGAFKLTRSRIESLRTKALRQDETSTLDCKTLSPFVVASAHVLTCMVRATLPELERDRVDDRRKLYFIVGVDYRSRLEPPVPGGYLGNCAGSHLGQTLARECFREDGLAVVAGEIRRLIKGLDKGILEGAEERLSRWGCLEPDSHVVALTWSPKFGVYGADFGFGRPKKVEIVSVHRKAVSLTELSGDDETSGGGLEIGIVLTQHEMDRFALLLGAN